MKTIRLYKRVSCQSQRDSGLGILGQHKSCMDFVNAHHAGSSVVEYVDDGLSGTWSIF